MPVDVATLIKKAGEVAKLVPEHLQEAAFNRAYDTLLDEQGGTARKSSPSGAGGSQRAKGAKVKVAAGADQLATLDRTAHPEISHNGKVLDNSLRLMRAAKDDLGVDGLSASAIAKILVDKFRCRLSRRGVSQALNNAGRYVNRHKEGNAVIFRLMGPGEDYLTCLVDGDSSASDTPSASRKRAKRNRRRGQSSTAAPKQSEKKTKKTKKTKTSGRVGPGTAMGKLIEADFFASPQTIGAIIAKLQHDQGRTFKPNELSPQLLRWLRADKLSRTKNIDGQYEYFTP